ncbi:hypothetical protein BDQ17DRAFT_857025 [Cyathus striatus]|nr:hypothetical protein BDQ17DRAFT_857025 [Cyathus striatus]
MFNAATNFVIQNSVFIEMRDNVTFYANKTHDKRTTGMQFTERKSTDEDLYPITPNYRSIRKGDMTLIDYIECATPMENDYYTEYIVRVVEAKDRKVARIYHGRDAYARFKAELDIMSDIWHPRIFQIFGVYKSNDTIGLLFHDDGTRRSHGEYIISLKPLQRAAFCIKYVRINLTPSIIWIGIY